MSNSEDDDQPLWEGGWEDGDQQILRMLKEQEKHTHQRLDWMLRDLRAGLERLRVDLNNRNAADIEALCQRLNQVILENHNRLAAALASQGRWLAAQEQRLQRLEQSRGDQG